MSFKSRIIDGVRLALAKVQAKLEQPTLQPAPLALPAPAPAVIDTRTELFGSYAERLLARRIAKGLRSRKDARSVLDTHLMPVFRDRPLGAVTTREVREFVEMLRKKPHARSTPEKPRTLANNTVLNIYGMLRAIFGRAVREDILDKNPCKLGDEDLPEKTYAIEDFQKVQIYECDEVIALLDLEKTGAHPLPDHWRQLYRAVYWTGGRIGEVCALTFARVELDLKPLGKATLAKSYSSKNKEVGPTKTGDIKELPIHPQWAPHFREWCESGYEQYTGRKPTPDAIVFPAKGRGTKRGRLFHRSSTVVLHRLHDDLDKLGFRKRRTHDLRRTFITMIANTDGINHKLLHRLTHSRGGAVIENYIEHKFEAVCREFMKVRLEKSTPAPLDKSGNEADTAKETHEQATAECVGVPQSDERAGAGEADAGELSVRAEVQPPAGGGVRVRKRVRARGERQPKPRKRKV